MSIRSALFLVLTIYVFSEKLRAQDTIIFEGSHLYIVEITEERERNIIFKKLDEMERTGTYVLDKRFVTDIRYHDPAAAAKKYNPEPLYEQRPLELWILPTDTDKVFRGELEMLTDSTVVFKRKRNSKAELPSSVDVFPYQKIKTVSVRRRDRVRKSALIGAFGGFATGTMIGLLSFEDTPPCDPTNIDGVQCDPSLNSPRTRWEKAFLLGAGGGGTGMIAGALIGSVKVRIPIEGRKDAYNVAIPRLERMSRKKR